VRAGRVLLCVLTEALFREHERVRKSRKDHVEGLAEERRGVLRNISTVSAIMFACVTTGDRHATDIKETAAVDAWVSPPARDVDVFPGIVRCSGTVVCR
jgi:hypothetical protein